jgi:hypothetical protein
MEVLEVGQVNQFGWGSYKKKKNTFIQFRLGIQELLLSLQLQKFLYWMQMWINLLLLLLLPPQRKHV